MRGYLNEAGRDPASFGWESRLNYQDTPDTWNKGLARWAELGGTHMAVNIMSVGLDSPAKQLEALRRFAAETGIKG